MTKLDLQGRCNTSGMRHSRDVAGSSLEIRVLEPKMNWIENRKEIRIRPEQMEAE